MNLWQIVETNAILEGDGLWNRFQVYPQLQISVFKLQLLYIMMVSSTRVQPTNGVDAQWKVFCLLENEFQGSQSPEFHPSNIFCAWRFLSRHMKYRSYKNDNIFYLTTCQWLYIFIDHTIARYIRIYSNIYSPECKEKQNTHLDQEEMIYLKRNYFLFMLDEYTKWIDGAFGGRLAAERKKAASHFSSSCITKYTWSRQEEQFLINLTKTSLHNLPSTADYLEGRTTQNQKQIMEIHLLGIRGFLCFELWKSCSFNFILLREELIRLELWLCSKEICVVFVSASVFNLKLLNFTCSLTSEDREKLNISIFICVEVLPCTETSKRSHPT